MGIIKKFRIKSFKSTQPIISLENISLSFGKRKILDNMSFKINNGEILGMLGPNGVGKSTIFNLITGLIKPDYGKIKFDGVDVINYPIYLRTTKFKIGYVPQYGGYFAALDVLTIKMLQEIIVNLQTESNITICICDHQARDLLSCVDMALIISNCKVIAHGTPSDLVNNNDAKKAYFGDSFKFN